MYAHHIDANGVILNTIVVDSLDFMPGLVDANIGGQIGDSIIDGQLVPAAAPAVPVPKVATRRQSLQAIYLIHGMTEDQVEHAIIQAVPDPTQQYLTLVEFRASQTFEYERAAVVQMCAVLGWDRDALFIKAGSLP